MSGRGCHHGEFFNSILGLRTDHLRVSSLNLPAASYGDPARQARFVRDLLTRLEAVPGVVSAAAAVEFAPFGAIATEFDIDGLTHSSIWKGIYSPFSSRYFETVGLRRMAGRFATAGEELQRRQVAVVNESLGRHYFGAGDPIGRQIQISGIRAGTNGSPNPWFEIIGVISDMKNNGAREPVLPAIYIPYTAGDVSRFNIYLHTAGNPGGFQAALCLASFTTRLIASQIYGVSPYDRLTFAAAIVVLTVMGLLASHWPSARAAKVDPAVCLRTD